MLTKKQFKKSADFQSHLQAKLKDPKFKKYYDGFGKQLEIAYQILQLRKKAGISQLDLARKIGTTQGNIARIETGRQNFSTETLVKIAKALNKDLKVEFV